MHGPLFSNSAFCNSSFLKNIWFNQFLSFFTNAIEVLPFQHKLTQFNLNCIGTLLVRIIFPNPNNVVNIYLLIFTPTD
jgi:hypothetical protein